MGLTVSELRYLPVVVPIKAPKTGKFWDFIEENDGVYWEKFEYLGINFFPTKVEKSPKWWEGSLPPTGGMAHFPWRHPCEGSGNTIASYFIHISTILQNSSIRTYTLVRVSECRLRLTFIQKLASHIRETFN